MQDIFSSCMAENNSIHHGGRQNSKITNLYKSATLSFKSARSNAFEKIKNTI
jgi:hypothetical protein